MPFQHISLVYLEAALKSAETKTGGILYNVSCDQRVWDVVKIDCKSMEEVLQDSYIVNIS